MSNADDLLETEPELKALVEKISKTNRLTNISAKLIGYLANRLDKSILAEQECKELMSEWIDAQKAVLRPEHLIN